MAPARLARVLLVPGIWMPGWSMRWLAKQLAGEGFSPRWLGYAGVSGGPQPTLPRLREAMASADAVVMIYLHLPPALRPAVHAKLVQALKPGGLLLLEAFHPKQLGYSSGGPKDEAMLYTLDMLRADLADGMEEVMAEEGPATLDEGPGHQGPAWVTRWIGRKSAA